jgi:TolA-binding protein
VIIGEAPEPSGTGWFNPPSDWSVVVAEPRWPLDAGNPAVSAETSQAASPQNSQTPETSADLSRSVTESADSNDETDFADPALSSHLPSDDASDTTLTMPENADPEDYMQKAQEEFDAGRVAGAISILEQFRQRFPSGSDEAFWLLGQFYEANSPSRDIRTSLDYYQRLINEYPQSRRYAAARARIAYLERFYLNIR